MLSGKFISDAMKFITDERMDLLALLSKKRKIDMGLLEGDNGQHLS